MSNHRFTLVLCVTAAALAAGLSGSVRAQESGGLPTAEADAAPPPDAWTLEICILTALENSPEVQVAAEAVVSAEAAVDSARSGRYPQVSADAEVGAGEPTSSGARSIAYGDIGLSVDWTAYKTGRLDAERQTRAELDAAHLDYYDAIQALVETVAVDYYAVLAANELVAVAEDGLKAARGHLHDVETRIAFGDSPEIDIHQAEEDVAQAEMDLIDAKSDARVLFARLRNVLGLDHTAEFGLARTAPDLEEALPAMSDAVATAYVNRRDIGASRATIRARRFALHQTEDARGPSFEVGASTGLAHDFSNGGSARWSLSAGMSWPIFDGGSRRASEDRARSSLRQAEASLRITELQVALETEEAIIELERATEQIAAAEKSLEAATAQLDAARKKLAANKGILLEVTDARAAYTSAGAALVRARFDRQVAVVALRRATGTLPIPSTPEPAPEGEPTGD